MTSVGDKPGGVRGLPSGEGVRGRATGPEGV